MASLHDDDVDGALAGLLDDWSDSELLPLLAPSAPLSGGADCSVEAASSALEALANAKRNSPKAKRSSDSNVTRKRERDERRRLEVEAHGLETQLASALQRRDGPGGSARRGERCNTAEMWAKVARSQLAAKQKAELQNMALRELLGEQLRLARSMQRMVHRRPSDTALLRVLGGANLSAKKRLRSDASADEEMTFQRLFERVDRNYDELDRVFPRDGDSSDDSRAKASEGSQFMYSTVIPFGMRAAMAAAWGFLSRDQYGVPGGEYRVVKRSASTIASESVSTIDAPSEAASSRDAHTVLLRCAMRKTEERDRIVLVWQSTTTTESQSSRSRTSELSMEQSGWLVLSSAAASSSGASVTKIQMCVRHPAKMDARLGDSGGLCEPGLGYQQAAAAIRGNVLGELLFRDAGRNVDAWYQYVENILMEQQCVGGVNV